MHKLRRLRGWPRSRIRQFVYALLSFTVIWQQILVVQPVSAAISQRGTVTSNNSGTSNVTSLTINKPTGVIPGDVMLATVAFSGTQAITAPSGWVSIETVNPTTSSTIEMGTWYKVAGASEGASYQWSWTGTQRAAGTIVAFSGVDNTTPIDNAGTAHSQLNGSSGAPATFTITTSTANTMLVASFADISNTANMAVASAATAGAFDSELAETASNSATTPNVDTAVDTKLWSGSGSTGAVFTSGTVGRWVARVVALAPAGNPTINQADYRWSVNADNAGPTNIDDNITANADTLNGTAIDTINGMYFAVGTNASNWVIEKRRTGDGALCTSSNCTTTFGTAGRITEDVASSTTETAYDVAIDPNGGYIYVVGSDNVTGGGQWRIEKRLMSDGSLVSGFGTGGVVQVNTSSSLDEALTVLVDNTNGYLYVGGYDGTAQNQWSLQKFQTSTGAAVTAFGTSGIYIYDGSHGDDRISSLEIDPTNSYLYVSGFTTASNNKTAWTVQKMLASTAGLCTAANCGTQFGTAGTYTSDPTSRDDKILTMQVDDAGGTIYLGGSESSGTTSANWRIEKITLNTGTLVSGFGGSGCATNVGGAVCTSFTAGLDKVYDMTLDGAGGYLYVLGVTDEAGTTPGWRLQKRDRSTGALVSSFASSGTAANPRAVKQVPSTVVLDVDRSLLWVTGSDNNPGNLQWEYWPLNIDSGTYWMAAADTAAVSSTSISFRLHLLLGVSGQQMLAGAQSWKLQYSPKVGTCDTGFVGESYQDVPTSGANEILYHDNPSVTDGDPMVALSGEPTDGSNTTVTQTIEEGNNFTNSVNDVGVSQDGEWDFILNDNFAFGPYCFRVLTSTGSQLDSYTQIPEITFCKNDPKTDNLLRHGTYFCGGIKKGFFWTN